MPTLLETTEPLRLALSKYLDLHHYLPESRDEKSFTFTIVFEHEGQRLWFKSAWPFEALPRVEEMVKFYSDHIINTCLAGRENPHPARSMAITWRSRSTSYVTVKEVGGRTIEFIAANAFIHDAKALDLLINYKFDQLGKEGQ